MNTFIGSAPTGSPFVTWKVLARLCGRLIDPDHPSPQLVRSADRMAQQSSSPHDSPHEYCVHT
jgi:hypothetical protein